MTTILLIVIYICYIGLGVPDSLIGVAWPAIYPEFDVPVSAVSMITLLISGGTIVSSFFSARIINHFGTGRVTAISTSMTAAALLGFSVSHNLIWLCLCAIPLGLGAGSIDTALNNYAALHYKATHMSFLHCFYGVGVSMSPYIMSLALSDDLNWRRGYRVAFFIQLCIALVAILSLPVWRWMQKTPFQEEPPRNITFRELLKIPGIKAQYSVFLTSCAMESVCLVWGSTFLVNARGMSAASAAGLITFYYVGMALGRFLSGILAEKLSSWAIIHIGQTVALAAIILLLIPNSAMFAIVGFACLGLGNSVVFPNMTYLMPKSFGTDISQSVIGTQMGFSNTGILLSPPLFGFLESQLGIDFFAPFLLCLCLMMLLSTWALKHILNQHSS